jgi:hypothetical protein
MTRRSLFAALAAPFARAEKRPEIQPFICCTIDDILIEKENFVGIQNLPIDATFFRVFVDGTDLAETQGFDTRSRSVCFVRFTKDGIPPVLRKYARSQERPIVLNPWLKDDVVGEGWYVGPYTVKWKDQLGIPRTFEVC